MGWATWKYENKLLHNQFEWKFVITFWFTKWASTKNVTINLDFFTQLIQCYNYWTLSHFTKNIVDLSSGKTQYFLCVTLEPLPKHKCSHRLHLKESFLLISFFMVFYIWSDIFLFKLLKLCILFIHQNLPSIQWNTSHHKSFLPIVSNMSFWLMEKSSKNYWVWF
jgi:hypothetical protein